ncbi:DUF7009 family protein [Hymenobacter properus]|uniref:Uncharacterized protein n=1 Tax=Hymenobacter properus TaxID=2791026 RepID=A0A931BFS3_9BACT|nr:hypothetical protein [Hymenobacter properus]MBF9141482.1 hypothetical protein [Hymenobacter properus]MBR7720291.1 hypothetical protein [Microvirga sp. SRT04]
MKLRIEDDTLRLRLSDGEVAEFAEKGHVEGAVHFGPNPEQRLTYALERGSERPQTMPNEEPVQIHYEPGALTVLVPFALAKAWVETEQNGFSHDLPLSESQHLRILVEKDLDCKH